MDMILDKCIFQNSFTLNSVTYVVGTHSNYLIEAIQCAPTLYVNSIHECFTPQTFFSQTSQLFVNVSV